MIEEIVGTGFEIVGIQGPAAKGNCDAKLMFLVALTVQRLKRQLRSAFDEVQQGSGNRGQRRGLIIVAVERTEDPIPVRDLGCDSEPRVNRSFGNSGLSSRT